MKSTITFSLPFQFTFRKLPKTIIQTCLIVSMLFFTYNPLLSCGGPPVPPCSGKTVFLAKFTPGVVVFPAAGPITVPIGIVPFVSWDTRPICPFPVGNTTLTLTLNCVPSGNVIMQTFTFPTPTAPGVQLPAGLVNFIIPPGTFPPGSPPQLCLVVGTYTLSFSDGTTLTGVGDTEVCLVPPTPLDASKPRLNMTYISEDNSLYRSCRRGDQAIFYFLIDNNDPNQSVTLDLSSLGRQVAQLPQGYTQQNAYAAGVYAISYPVDSTDTFAAAFADDLAPGELMDEPDPFAADLQELNRSLTLKACESTIIGIAMRSFGMCANGSCNERLVKVEGTFEDGEPALACASTLYLVGEEPAKSPLCELSDDVKVDEVSIATWSETQFYENGQPIAHAQTFYVGNLPPSSGKGFRTVGEPGSDFKAAGSDYLRLTSVATEARYSMEFNRQQVSCSDVEPRGINAVTISGLNSPTPFLTDFPAISFIEPIEKLNIFFDVADDGLKITDANGNPLFSGSATEFINQPPREFCVFKGICRSIKKRSDFNEKAIYVVPPARSRLFDLSVFNPAPCEARDSFEVFNQDSMYVRWRAAINGNGIGLPSNTGFGLLEICYENLSGLASVPNTTVSFVEVSCPNAINNPQSVPVAIRVKDNAKILNSLNSADELDKHQLFSGFPNPFNSTTSIRYTLGHTSEVSLRIYNHLGQEVRTLVPPKRSIAGDYIVDWNGTDGTGNLLESGVYICQMKADGWISTKKMILIK